MFICYFVWGESHTPWPVTFVWWAWVPYVLHVFLHRFMDGLQNTTRNIARIYLIQNHGLHYDNRLVNPIQNVLIPDSILPVTILWQFAHALSFCLLLFLQGWFTALVAEFALMFFSGILPLSYQSHLKRIHRQAESLDSTTSFRLLMVGIYPKRLSAIISQAIQESKNPQQWWSVILRDAIKEEVTSKPDTGDGL